MEDSAQQEAIAIFYLLFSIHNCHHVILSSCHRVTLLTGSWPGRWFLPSRAVEIGRLVVELPCRSRFDRSAALGQQIDRPVDRDANVAGAAVGPAVAM